MVLIASSDVGGLSFHPFYRYKVRRLRHRQVLLEQLVAQRTHELEVQNHSLEVMAHHVEDMAEEKIRFFTHLTHEFRTPVI